MTACCGAAPAPEWWRLAVALFVSLNSMTVALTANLSRMDEGDRLLLQGIPLAGCLVCAGLLGGPLWRALRLRRVTVETLFALSAAGAFGVSMISLVTGRGPVFFEVVSILLTVYGLGRALGRHSQQKVLEALTKVLPAEAPVAGGVVRVHPGAMVPVDGTVLEGTALVNEASLTGEGFAVRRGPGERVVAGSHVLDATLVVEPASGPSSLDGIAALVRQAALAPGRSQAAAERMMSWFVPVVASVAGVTFLVHGLAYGLVTGLFRGMAVLLVACPCALGFATPLAVWTAMRRLDALGLTVKSGDAVERLAEVDCVAFDKTGTLTLPEPRPEVEMADGWARPLVESLVAAAERAVEHPVARALRGLGEGAGFAAESAEVLQGWGVAALVRGGDRRYAVRIVRLEDAVEHRLSVEVDGARAAVVRLREEARAGVAATVRSLEAMGLECLLLTGDGAARAARLPLDNVRSRLAPADKAAMVRRMQAAGRRVLYVGDGLNDAAAAAESHVAIAVEGAEVTRAAAAIEWAEPRLAALPEAIAVCRTTAARIRTNLRIAVAYNLVGMGAAAAGLVHPVLAALLMTVSSGLVTFRSLALLEGGGR